MMTRKHLALLHVGKKKLGLDDHTYRAILIHVAGVDSAKDLDKEGFEAVLGFYSYLGFNPMVSGQDFGEREGMASFPQLEMIRTLWQEYTRFRYGSEDELNKWLLRSFKVSCLRFLDAATAQKAITALRHMKARAT